MARRDAILDSSVLVQHARVRDERRSYFVRSLSAYDPSLSVMTVYELEFGAYRAERQSDIETLRASFNILPVTKDIAQRAAALDADLIH